MSTCTEEKESVSRNDDRHTHTHNECSVNIHSNWHCATNNGLEKSLVVQEDLGEEVDPTQLMSTDTCVFLTKEGKDVNQTKTDSCSITLQISGNTVFSNLSILSEARLLEVYGLCDEYLKTVQAEYLLEDEDTIVYCADIKIDNPCNHLLLKFHGLNRENALWLYGISVCWKVSPSKNFPNGTQALPFNLEAVDRRLSDLGLDLPPTAQKYKKFLELCSSKSQGDTTNTDTIKPLISTLVSSILQGSNPRRKGVASNEKHDLEVLLDEKLRKVERHILDEVDKRIQEMEKRQQALITDGFEKIMKQLQLGFNLNGNEPGTS